MEVTKDQRQELQSWLNKINKRIEEERDTNTRRALNSKYIGALKLVDRLGGEVRYYSNLTHEVKMKEIPTMVDVTGFSTYQTIGALEFMYSAGLNPSLQNTKITIRRTLWKDEKELVLKHF